MARGHKSGFDPNAFGPFGALFQTYFAGLESFSQGNSAFDAQSAMSAPLKAAARCQLEVLGLVNRRAQAYMQMPTRLAQCRTPQDLVNEQLAFWRTAGAQYSETSRKVADAWSTVGPWSSFANGGMGAAERDYINFNGTGSKDSGAQTPWPEQPAGKQRRVA